MSENLSFRKHRSWSCYNSAMGSEVTSGVRKMECINRIIDLATEGLTHDQIQPKGYQNHS